MKCADRLSLEGLFESPHDNPPKWAFMLIAYLDESMENNPRGYTVMAGFLGNKNQWTTCAEEWRKALVPKQNLHVKKLRGWKNNRHEEMLKKLAAVPYDLYSA